MLTNPTAEKQRILVVDDTVQNIHILTETLKDRYKILAATSGSKALELASRSPQPDLILLDVMMPQMSGYEVCSRLKIDPATRQIPVIFITALTDACDEEKGLELGAVDFITKPFNPALVKARVKNQLDLKQHRDFLEEEVVRRTQELLSANLERQKLESELEVARNLQSSMLAPSKFLPSKRESAEVAALLIPARAVGGDLYDYVMLADNTILVAVGDVSGKGVAAALFMMRALTLLRSLAESSPNPCQLLNSINQSLCSNNEACMFVTLGCFILNLATGDWQYSSGGHEPPIISDNLESKFLNLESGPALGLFKDASYPLSLGRLKPGSTLLLYSDGVTEAEDMDQALFGSDRLLENCSNSSLLKPNSLIEKILADIKAFVGSNEQSDDLTMLALNFYGAAS